MEPTRIRETLGDIMDGVRTQPARAGLSALAIGVGMVALTMLFAVLGGLREKARHLSEELGLNVLAIIAEKPASGANAGRHLDRHCASLLAGNMPQCLVSTVRHFGFDGPAKLVATDGNLAAVRQLKPLRGRFLDAYDVLNRTRVAVISDDLATLDGWDIGRTARLKDILFTIVGVVASGNGAIESENSDLEMLSGQRAVFVPVTTAALWLDSAREDSAAVDCVLVRAPDRAGMDRAERLSDRLLASPDVRCSSYRRLTADKVLAGVRRTERMLLATVGGVAFLCILLGGATLAGLMMTNVRDRIPEIGLRKALGARKADIAALFVVEGAIVAGAGSLAGVCASHVFLLLAGDTLPFPAVVGLPTLLGPLAVALTVGALASYWPARLAASIAPAEALRTE